MKRRFQVKHWEILLTWNVSNNLKDFKHTDSPVLPLHLCLFCSMSRRHLPAASVPSISDTHFHLSWTCCIRTMLCGPQYLVTYSRRGIICLESFVTFGAFITATFHPQLQERRCHYDISVLTAGETLEPQTFRTRTSVNFKFLIIALDPDVPPVFDSEMLLNSFLHSHLLSICCVPCGMLGDTQTDKPSSYINIYIANFIYIYMNIYMYIYNFLGHIYTSARKVN